MMIFSCVPFLRKNHLLHLDLGERGSVQLCYGSLPELKGPGSWVLVVKWRPWQILVIFLMSWPIITKSAMRNLNVPVISLVVMEECRAFSTGSLLEYGRVTYFLNSYTSDSGFFRMRFAAYLK